MSYRRIEIEHLHGKKNGGFFMGISLGSTGTTAVSSTQEVKVLKASQKQEAAVMSKIMESVEPTPAPRGGDTGRRVNVQA
jgi:hypothetical protein